MNVIAPKFGMGASARRLEDAVFITGRGRYTDDIAPEGVVHGYVLRSPIAKGRFTIGSIEAARKAPGVHLVLTAADLGHLQDLKTAGMQRQADGSRPVPRDIPILCRDEVNYVGDAVAFIVADSRAQAQDASELIEIEYKQEDAVVRTAASTDTAFVYQLGDPQSSDTAFSGASTVTRIAFHNNRLVCNYMEPRAAIGEWNEAEGRYTLTTGSQGVHSMRRIIAENVMGISQEQLRVITPDVGGGFGPKVFVYREYPLVLEAARRLGRPVKWTGDRTEHFLTDAQGRDNVVEAEMAMDAEGRFLALRVRNTANMGAYAHQFGPAIPWMGSSMSTGVYHIPALDVRITGVYTNTCPVDAYRGAGRPEAAFLVEKLVDACARDLGLSPAEIRRRNFIRPDQFPYHTPAGRMYDVGEFEGHMDVAMQRADWAGFDARAEAAKSAGKIRGIGMATYIEACAFAGSEPAHVVLDDDGTITLLIGTQSNGQGHATAYAQLVAEKLNVDIDRIKLHQGDTDRLDSGGGTGGSRSIPLGGVSAARAGEDLAVKIRKIAADELEAAEADIELENGVARIVGTDRSMDFAAIAKAARSPDDIKGFGEFVQDEATYPNGTHICEVEIDPETGKTEIVNYVIVDDFGATVNPMLLAGQVHGGVVQGLGQALTEDAIYGDDGQILTATFMDYAMPRADDVPSFHFETRNVPSTTNAMGIKGAGEAGTIGSSPALMNAITDALHRTYGIGHIEMPATPHRIWQAISQAASSR